MQNETLASIANRSTCRVFNDKPVEKEKLEAIALAGVQAPSSNNMQGWRITVISDKEYIEQLDRLTLESVKETNPRFYERLVSRGGKALYNAPVLFVVSVPQQAQYPVDLDSGIVCENMALAAESLGLGSCINRVVSNAFFGPEKESVYKAVGIQEGYEFSIGLLVGYAEKNGTPHEPDLSKVSYLEKVM